MCRVAHALNLFLSAAEDGEQEACRDSRADNACDVRSHSVHKQEVLVVLLQAHLVYYPGRHGEPLRA